MEFNLAEVFEAVAAAVPDRDCIVFGDRRLTFAEIDDRTARLARVLHDWGLGAHTERSGLAGYQSGQSHLALYMTNSNEYLEGMLGAYRARVAPFNVNYRYVSDELVYLLDNAHAAAVMYHAQFGPTLAEALDKLPAMRLIHVDDGSGIAPLPGAVRYEELLAAAPPEPLTSGVVARRSLRALHRRHHRDAQGCAVAAERHLPQRDGRPGVRHRGDDFRPGRDRRARQAGGPGSLLVRAADARRGPVVGFQRPVRRPEVRDCPRPQTISMPTEAWRLAGRERVGSMLIVGDAFGRPLADALEALGPGEYDLSALNAVVSGGALFSTGVKQRLLDSAAAA